MIFLVTTTRIYHIAAIICPVCVESILSHQFEISWDRQVALDCIALKSFWWRLGIATQTEANECAQPISLVRIIG